MKGIDKVTISPLEPQLDAVHTQAGPTFYPRTRDTALVGVQEARLSAPTGRHPAGPGSGGVPGPAGFGSRHMRLLSWKLGRGGGG